MQYKSFSITASSAEQLQEGINKFFEGNTEITVVSAQQSQSGESAALRITYTVLYKVAGKKGEGIGFGFNAMR